MFTSAMMLFQDNMVHFNSRKLLVDAPMNHHIITTMVRTGVEAIAAAPTQSPNTVNKSFDANVVMVLSVLLCALVCSLALNSIIRCVLRCSSLLRSESIATQESSPGRLANTGIKKKVLRTFPTVRYWEGLKLPGLYKECAICLSEFVSEEQVKILPKCSHGFHVKCVDKWLSSHSSCPTCRHSLIETSEKILSGGARSITIPSQVTGHIPITVSAISIVPLQHEGVHSPV